ncbi:bacterial Ig-like domain-containing protein [Enterococcus faecalis]|uniref:bacterial Ig-like domain-containing protein n=1 Tax=Enterococcus TaxID=1350 RepID=UPI0025AFE918|nr:bacterial Ig-like domain-containing protein [Enterococcus faecalis]MDN3074176.1 bacterial Ig-like domain-containing protein [Enterococcus faecalis]MDN3101250.1 bacterial Ig-like domain-containing protein [Enterococcus faecalis]MDN3103994.1 bacterial Ig-like domain-containing protein [Enterococcus faecalis]
MRKKFILLLFVLIFSIKQEEVVFSEIETVSTQAKIIESYDNTLRYGLHDMQIINPYYIDEGEVFNHIKVVLDATDEEGFKVPFFEIKYKWEDKALDTSKKGNTAVALLYWEKDPFITYRATIKVAYDLILQTQNSTIYQGEIWDPVTNFVRANDEDSDPVYWNDDRIKTNNASIDTNVPGVYYRRYTLKGQNKEQNKEVSSTFKVTVKEDQTKAELKDTELHVGQKWDLGSIFKNVVDKDGNPIKPEEIERVWIDDQETREIDTSKPGKHTVQIAVLKANNEWSYSNKVTVTIKEDQTKAELKDTELYVGQKWDLGSVFKNVVDKDGNPIKPEKVNYVWIDGNKTREIDTSKPGKHTVKIAILKENDEWVYSNEVTVKVKEDKTKAELKDTELYVGQKWGLGSVFKYAIDKDGNPIKLEQVPWVYIDGKQIDLRENKTKELIDTNKPGTHTVSIAIRNAADVGHAYEWAHSNEVTVTVKEEPFTIKQVPYFDFEDHILVSTNKSVVNKKEEPIIEVETPSINGKDWHLQVELSPFLDKKNSKSILKGVSLFIPKGKLESDLETEEPTQYDCQLEANGKASILMHGTKTKGKGRWKNKLETKGITLSIPSENKTGNYESTLHWTLLDVPG